MNCWQSQAWSRRAIITKSMVAAGVAMVSGSSMVAGVEPANANVPTELPQERWEEEVRAFEVADRRERPRPGQILFVGSSSIRLWDVARDFPNYDILNRGFGGSQMSDLARLTGRLVIPYRPRLIVIYEGDNDIANEVQPAEIVKSFERFVDQVADRLPTTQIIVLSIKPSVARWKLYDVMQETNEMLVKYCQQHARCQFVDVGSSLLNEQGEPDPQYFINDGLHLNERGYARWARIVEPFLAVR